MKLLSKTWVILATTALCSLSLKAAPIKHEFLAIDEGLSNLMRVNETNPTKNWLVSINKEHPRDMQLIGNNQLLISHDHGYSVIDLSNGKIIGDESKYHDVSSVRRLPNGNTLIVGVDFDTQKLNKGTAPIGDEKGKHVIIAEYNTQGTLVKRAAYTGDYARLARETAQGTYLVACNTEFREGDRDGNWIKTYPVEGFNHAWKANRLANGNIIMSAGYGLTLKKGSSFMIELDPQGNVVRKFGAKNQVQSDVNPYFYGLFQVLTNGNIVVANWQGHKAGHNYSGRQIVEFNKNNEIVWSWSDRAFVSSIQAVFVLDGLDTMKFHDERNGIVAPINSGQN
jgi:hypothetical protein